MLSPMPRDGAGRRFAPGARAFLLLTLAGAWAAAAPGTVPPLPAKPPASKKAAALPATQSSSPSPRAVADPTAELQRLAEEADQVEPSAPDAVARLKSIVRGLIEVVKADRREVVALRAGSITRVTAPSSRRRSRKKLSPGGPASALAAPAPAAAGEPDGSEPASETPAVAGAFFGKRGLKKFHRPGCVFGERIHAEDRVYFKTVAEATAAGYEACKICKPGG